MPTRIEAMGVPYSEINCTNYFEGKSKIRCRRIYTLVSKNWMTFGTVHNQRQLLFLCMSTPSRNAVKCSESKTCLCMVRCNRDWKPLQSIWDSSPLWQWGNLKIINLIFYKNDSLDITYSRKIQFEEYNIEF